MYSTGSNSLMQKKTTASNAYNHSGYFKNIISLIKNLDVVQNANLIRNPMLNNTTVIIIFRFSLPSFCTPAKTVGMILMNTIDVISNPNATTTMPYQILLKYH